MAADERRFRQTVLLGTTITVVGLICLGGGVALLGWRLLNPEKAAFLPPGAVKTPEPTPTVGVFKMTVAPPPLPDDFSEIVILPISEQVSPTREPATLIPSVTPSPTTVIISPTSTTAMIQPTNVSITISAPRITSAPTLTIISTPSPTPPVVIPDRILIESIGLSAPVVPVGQHPLRVGKQVYSQWDVPDVFAAGWHQNSAPLGQPGNTVLNGHHNVNGEVFRYLIEVEPGDRVILESQGRRFEYIAVQTMTLLEEGQPLEVRQENARWILPTEDERVTLITCWPYHASTHRLVLIAMPKSALEKAAELP